MSAAKTSEYVYLQGDNFRSHSIKNVIEALPVVACIITSRNVTEGALPGALLGVIYERDLLTEGVPEFSVILTL